MEGTSRGHPGSDHLLQLALGDEAAARVLDDHRAAKPSLHL